MKTKKISPESVYAKLLALSVIYSKKEGCRRTFLERISYNHNEMKAVITQISDPDFRIWVEAAIPVMQCRKIV